MSRKENPYITAADLASQIEYLRKIQEVEASTHTESETLDRELYQAVTAVCPKEHYGAISGTEVLPEFKQGFVQALHEGRVDQYLQQVVEQDPKLEGVYVIKASPVGLDAKQQKIHDNHQPEAIEGFRRNASELVRSPRFIQILETLPPILRKEYVRLGDLKGHTGEALLAIGTPDFTRHHHDGDHWEDLLGTGTRLPYAHIAEEMLVLPPIEEPFKTVADALSLFNLSKEETALIPEFDPTATELSLEQSVGLFSVFLTRLGLDEEGWRVETSKGAGINVNAQVKKIYVPETRIIEASELRYILCHEFVHVLRGVNGSGQSCTLLEKGLEGYLATEEGVAATAEMIVGEPFGSERQRKLAARYLAIDLALQTETVDGVVRPLYSTQEIYDRLTNEYHVTIRDATDIVWRITRGTSLRREIVTIDMKSPDGSVQQRMIPEVYTKDAVYFIGQQMLFQWFKDSLPQHAKLSEHLTRQTDFTDISLLIIRKILQQHGLTSEPSRASDRERLMKEGRQALLRLIDHLLVGKMSLKDMADPEWQELLRPGRISYSRLFEPRRDPKKSV